jgi:hypothetical protein
VKSTPTRGCSVDCGSQVPGPYAHEFCGEAGALGALCSSCARPLVQLLSLDTRDPLLETSLPGLPRIPLLFCWGCRSDRGASFYALTSERAVPLRRARRPRSPEWPYADYPSGFPTAPARLVPLPKEVQTHLRGLNRRPFISVADEDSRRPRHQVGGEPLLLAPWRTLTCPRCRRRMPFLAAIADENLDARGFSGNPLAQVLFHLCRACRTLGAYSQRLVAPAIPA